jgi:hypothetical protein
MVHQTHDFASDGPDQKTSLSPHLQLRARATSECNIWMKRGPFAFASL